MNPKPVILWCSVCSTGYGSRGERPATCPNDRCLSTAPNWTTTPPYKISVNDKKFLRSLRIDPA